MVCARVWVGHTHVFQRTWGPPGPHRPTGGVVDFPPRRAARHYSPSSRTSPVVAPLAWYNCYSSKRESKTGQPSAEQPQSRSMWCFNWVPGTFLFAHANFKMGKVQADEFLCSGVASVSTAGSRNPDKKPDQFWIQIAAAAGRSRFAKPRFCLPRISTLFSFSTISFSSLGSSTIRFSTLVLTLKTCGPPST